MSNLTSLIGRDIIIYAIDKIVHTRKFYLQNYPNIFSFPRLSLIKPSSPHTHTHSLSLSLSLSLLSPNRLRQRLCWRWQHR